MVKNVSLEMLYEWGVKLFISGKPATPKMVTEFLLRNRNYYMPDFAYDEEGNLDEIRY